MGKNIKIKSNAFQQDIKLKNLEKFNSTPDSRMGSDGWSARHKTEKWKNSKIIKSGRMV